MTELLTTLKSAVADGRLLNSSLQHLEEWLGQAPEPLDLATVQELVSGNEWTELNDRFFKKLAFGTSGLRGRTIGKIVTRAEQGSAAVGERPQHPCVGSNAMNYRVVDQATRGLVAYARAELAARGESRRPRLVFAHDTRHFSREIATFCAKLVTEHGGDAYLFESHRPTPELSFAIRHLDADGGVMHTASHNPAHDNGYKVYFADGSGIIDPGASELSSIIAQQPARAAALPAAEQGTLHHIGAEVDQAYTQRLRDVFLQPDLLRAAKSLKVVYTAIHGTGGVHVPQLIREAGITLITVPEQDIPDGRFPTVDSPNPENASALQMALDLAEKERADIVIGTDPDCDRMGVAVRDQAGQLQLLTGNQIGSLMAWYRITTMVKKGWINETNRQRAVLVKTYVTTDLQSVIARRHGLRVTNTLTGFKYIGAKQLKYERLLPADVQARYRDVGVEENRQLHLKQGMFYVFGGEESYGYLGADFVRDKDGNMAVLMFTELAALAASEGRTVIDLMNDVYAEYGFFSEYTPDLKLEGAEGAAKIKTLIQSYAQEPPAEMDDVRVQRFRHFGQEDIIDEEGDLVPKENMLMIELVDGRRFAVRPSGTEPKVKFYFFGQKLPTEGQRLSADALAQAKAEVPESLQRLWSWVQKDVQRRIHA
jgi:phosphoglucomutase